jgi:hypothetical protein
VKLPVVDTATTSLPPLFGRWVADALPGPLPPERVATCDHCVMLPPAGAAASEQYFDPAVKCCTFTPKLPSFLVGSILADTDPALAPGRERIRERIERRVAVTPLGVYPPKQFTLLYKPGTGSFGRSLALRCPYYAEASGGCTIWRHRNSVCSTWFCKHERGQTSARFWNALSLLLGAAELTLLRHCLLELDIGADALRLLFPHPHETEETSALDDLDGRVDEARYRALWGRWLGREEELYVAAASLVAPLAWRDVVRIGGTEVEIRARIAEDAFARLAAEGVPERLHVASLRLTQMGREAAQAVTYNRFDPIELPHELLAVLPLFDGSPTPEVLAKIEAEHGLVLEEDLVRKLVDFGVLTP